MTFVTQLDGRASGETSATDLASPLLARITARRNQVVTGEPLTHMHFARPAAHQLRAIPAYCVAAFIRDMDESELTSLASLVKAKRMKRVQVKQLENQVHGPCVAARYFVSCAASRWSMSSEQW